MKKLIAIIVGCFLFFIIGNGQIKQVVAVETTGQGLTFEEKQKIALQNGEAEISLPQPVAFNFRYAARKATPAVVHIKAVYTVQAEKDVPDLLRDFFEDYFWRHYFQPDESNPQVQTGSASGVIVSDDGYIVTNNHVVTQSESIVVVLHDHRSYKAKIVGTDPATDLALLKIEENDLPFIEFGNSDSVEVGDMVLAVGNPFNLSSTVTAGIVSAKARNINILKERFAVESYIQTDAVVNPGNSGGALVDINGKLVGINAAIATPTGVYAGYAFAIPVDIVKKTIDDLLLYGKAMRGYLGIVMADMDGEKAKKLGLTTYSGVEVDSLLPGGAAVQGGIQREDVIIRADDHAIESVPQLREIIATHHSGENLQLTVLRAGQEEIIQVKLMPLRDGTGGFDVLRSLGIGIRDLSAAEKKKWHLSGGIEVISIGNGTVSDYTNMRAGFIITKVNNRVVNTTDEFLAEMRKEKSSIIVAGRYPGMPGLYYYEL
jgi:serine protease Do